MLMSINACVAAVENDIWKIIIYLSEDTVFLAAPLTDPETDTEQHNNSSTQLLF